MAAPFYLREMPTELSVDLLVRSLSNDCDRKGVSAKNVAHRSRVIRQQRELLARQSAPDPERRTSTT